MIFILYGILASAISVNLMKSPKTILALQRFIAVVFTVLAVKLALTER